MQQFETGFEGSHSSLENRTGENNSTLNGSNMNTVGDGDFGDEVPFHFPLSFHIAAHILYNAVLLLGLVGNGCVLLIFSMSKVPFRKLPTPLLANLALGDLLITIFCLETGYLSLLWQYWPFGKFLCFAISLVKPIAVFVSCYTLIALSVDRYLGVKDPLKTGILSKENVRWTVGFIWVLAVGTSIPTGLFTSYEVHLLTGLPRCGEYVWESETKEMIYDVVLITLQYLVPVVVLIYTYTRITMAVCKNRSDRHRMSQGTSPRQKSLRTIRMSLMVVLGYAFAWLPYNVVSLLNKYHPPLGESDHFPYIFVACHWLAMSHSVYNPVIYFWLNESFRHSTLELFCRNKVRRSERRKLSANMSSWRSTVYTTTNGRSSISRNSTRLKSLTAQSPTELNNCFPYPPGSSPLLRGKEEENFVAEVKMEGEGGPEQNEKGKELY